MFRLIFFLAALTTPQLQKIGQQIWENESHRSAEKLIFWNPREAFPSLGIGHFIWYHEKEQAPFEETFPQLIQFLSDHQAKIPNWLQNIQNCPWKTREEFLSNPNDLKIQELRSLLLETIDLQTLFMYERFRETEKKIIQAAENPKKIQKLLQQLVKTPQGPYALIDYTNFKGTGLSVKERYKNQGWGLLQVLETMPDDPTSEQAVKAFVSSAKEVLSLRVQNAPSDQTQWLKGWHARLDTYLKF